MIKLLFIIVIPLLFSSCSNSSSSSTINDTDSINGMTVAEWKKNYVDSLTNKMTHDAMFDTAGLYLAPIKVTKAYLYEKEYSNYRDISVTYKNVSSKKIDAVRLRWYGVNAFGDPADMGTSFQQGFGGGFDDDPLGPGKSRTASWSILSRDGKKVVLAWPIEVVFTDGTKWKL